MSEEDIKILKDIIQTYKDCGVEGYPEMVVDFSLSYREIQAIENTLNELEDRIKKSIAAEHFKITAQQKKIIDLNYEQALKELLEG